MSFFHTEADGNDGFTKLLLHFDAPNASTAFKDYSASSHTVSANGNAQVSTAQSQFGGSSCTFDGTTDYLSTPDSADWFLSNSNFTVDLWLRAAAIGGGVSRTILFQGQDANNFMHFFADTNASLGVTFRASGATVGAYNTTATFTTATWYHVAFVRSGASFFIFVNGASQSLTTFTAISTNSLGDYTSALLLGDNTLAPSGWNGFMDEVRFSNGTARWTANFTVPATSYG